MKQTHPYVILAGCKTNEEFYQKYPTEQHFFGSHPEAREQIPTGHMANGGSIPEQYFPHNFNAMEPIPQGHMQTGGFIMPAINPVDMPTRYTEMATGGRIEVDKPGYHFDGTRMVQNHGSTYDATTGAFFKDGGIHLNPANKGKFNATKARTGKTTEELTHSSDPVTRKRAVFAQNASHFHHQFGGQTMQTGGYVKGSQHELEEHEIQSLINQGYKIKYL